MFLPCVLWAVAALGLTVVYYKKFFFGSLVDAQAMDFAQIARNIAAGHGFATSIFRPLAVTGGFAPIDAQSWTTPDVSYPPLYPFVLAVVFTVTKHAVANRVVVTSLLFFLCSVWATYRLARTLFPSQNPPWTALLSAGIYLLGGEALRQAVNGTATMLITFLVTVFLIVLYRAHETGGRSAAPLREFAVGVMLGLCYLAQYSLLLVVIPTFFYMFVSRAPARAWRGVALCAAGFLLITAGWLIRTAHLSHGNPFFNLQLYGVMADTTEYPGVSSIYRSTSPSISPLTFFYTHLPEVFAKAMGGFISYRSSLLATFNLIILAGAVASVLWRSPDVRFNALRGYVAFCLLALVLVASFFEPLNVISIIAPFAPFLTVITVGYIFSFLQEQEWAPAYPRLVAWGLVLCVSFGTISQLEQTTVSPPVSENPVTQGMSLLQNPPYADQVKQGAVISDAPWEVVWRTGMPASWLPMDNVAYQNMAGHLPMASLLLTPTIADYANTPGEATPWVLLSTHPQAYDQMNREMQAARPFVNQRLTAQAQLYRNLVAAHDARLKGLTPARLERQIAAAQAGIPALVKQRQQQIQSDYNANYGNIAEVTLSYVPVAQRAESNRLPSTLFLRRDALQRH